MPISCYGSQNDIELFLKRKIPCFQAQKIVLDIDKTRRRPSVAWVSTEDRPTIEGLVKIHNSRWVPDRIQTFLMGYPYDDLDDEDEDEEDRYDIF